MEFSKEEKQRFLLLDNTPLRFPYSRNVRWFAHLGLITPMKWLIEDIGSEMDIWLMEAAVLGRSNICIDWLTKNGCPANSWIVEYVKRHWDLGKTRVR